MKRTIPVTTIVTAFLTIYIIFSIGSMDSKELQQTTITFDRTGLDLGKLKQGEPQSATFIFTKLSIKGQVQPNEPDQLHPSP